MNRSRLLMIGGLALAVGLLVAFTVYNQLRTSPGSSSNERVVPVVVAANDIQVGAKLDARDIRVITLPQSAVPPGAFSRTSQVLERGGAVLPISKGEFILSNKLAALERGSWPAIDDPAGNARGFRARQRRGFGGGLRATGHARGCAGYR